MFHIHQKGTHFIAAAAPKIMLSYEVTLSEECGPTDYAVKGILKSRILHKWLCLKNGRDFFS